MAEQIGRYQIKRILGQGGMATVYLAHDPEFNREVALKVLPAQLADDPQFLGRFRREAQTIAALEHPAIVPVYDFGQHDSRPYLVMRYMPGGSLEDKLSGGRSLTLPQSAALLDRLAPALDEVHRRGIVHRDLKPGNILFDSSSLPYLSDFGIVKINEGAAATLTAHGGTLGTPAYMSPEQARGESNIGSRSDIYALGVILFQVLTGELPFKADTPIGLAVAHINEPVPDIRTTMPELPAETAVLISQALAKNPQQRPATASAMARDLDRIAAGAASSTPSAHEDETVIEPLPTALAAGATTMDSGPPPVPPPAVTPAQSGRRRGPLTAIFGCLGLILPLALLAGYLFTIRGSLGLPADLAGGDPTATTAADAEEPTNAPSPTATTAEILPSATPLPTPVPPIGSSTTFVEYILDASGSMLEELQGKPKLLIARDVLTSRLNLLPPDINVGLRVYGHRLPWEDDEEASCRDIELVVPIGPAMGTQINALLPNIEAKGMTPMTESIRQAAADFTFTPDRNNLIVLLSDGIETCDEDPATAVMFLQELGIDFTIHVIGLNVDAAAQQQLQALAAAGGGVYYDANSEEDLNNALQGINEDIVQTAKAQATITETPTPEPGATTEPPSATPLPSATLPPPTATFTPPPPTTTAVPPTATAALPPTATETAVPPTATELPLAVPPSPTPAAEKKTVNATFEGKSGASSTYSGFPASLSVDGDRSTSWFSGGSAVDGRSSTYQWSINQDELITSVTIISNANNAVPDFRTGFGFEGLTIQIMDVAGNVVYENKAGLGGTPDPDVSFQPGVKGSTVLLIFSGHESPDCGGFGELVVMVER